MEQLIQQLKVILGTNFALYLKAHGYHWNIEGPNFPQYHDFLNTFYTEVFAQTDLIAEHVRYLDSYVPGSMERFLELATPSFSFHTLVTASKDSKSSIV